MNASELNLKIENIGPRGGRIRLAAESVSRPVYARYAWTDYSDQVNLFGENGLPLEPFNL